MVINIMNDNTKTCNRCKGNIISTESELVCSRCGIVVVENIVDVSRDYENQDGSGGRVGPPTNVMFKETKSSVISSKCTFGAKMFLRTE